MSKFVYVCCFFVLLAVAAFFSLPYMQGFGALDVKIVKSGSMEPSINTGGVVMIREIDSYTVGDVITFTSAGADIPTTHRIIGTEVSPDGGTYFVTKGDANEERDVELVSEENIIGKVLVDVPYVGFILDFARQPLGFALLIGVPAFIIILDELEKIWKAFRNRKRDGDSDDDTDISHESRSKREETVQVQNIYTPLVIPPLPSPRRVAMYDILPKRVERAVTLREHFAYEAYAQNSSRLAPSVIAVALVFGLTSLFHPFGGTVAFYRNVETSVENTLSAETIDFLLQPDGNVFTFIDGEVTDPDGALMTLVAPTGSSSALRYDIKVEFATGTLALCDSINVIAGKPINYGGVLTGLFAKKVILDTAWVLGFSLKEGAYLSGDVCEVDIVYSGWNETQNSGDGYDDVERMRLSFTTVTTEVPPFASLSDLSIFLADGPVDGEVPVETSEETKIETNGGGGGEGSGLVPELIEETLLPEEEIPEIIEAVPEPEATPLVEEEILVPEETPPPEPVVEFEPESAPIE